MPSGTWSPVSRTCPSTRSAKAATPAGDGGASVVSTTRAAVSSIASRLQRAASRSRDSASSGTSPAAMRQGVRPSAASAAATSSTPAPGTSTAGGRPSGPRAARDRPRASDIWSGSPGTSPGTGSGTVLAATTGSRTGCPRRRSSTGPLSASRASTRGADGSSWRIPNRTSGSAAANVPGWSLSIARQASHIGSPPPATPPLAALASATARATGSETAAASRSAMSSSSAGERAKPSAIRRSGEAGPAGRARRAAARTRPSAVRRGRGGREPSATPPRPPPTGRRQRSACRRRRAQPLGTPWTVTVSPSGSVVAGAGSGRTPICTASTSGPAG